MKNTTLKLILLFIWIFLGLSCKDSPTKPTPSNTVKLSLDYAECKEIGLKLNFTDADQPRGYALLRDGEQITSGTLGSTDISLVDTTVLPGRDYTYIAQRLNDSKTIDSSTPLTVHSLDSTSHAIQWFLDTLGAQGVIRDVWVFDRNNAWAVGEIYLKDSTGQINMSIRYNAARWDGNKWDLKMVSPEFRGSNITPPLDGIFCFSPTQIWMIGSLPIYGDGINWTIYDLRTTLDPNLSVSKAWGSDTKNVFFVGRSGSIARFDGATWHKMPSNTTVDLEDIYGLDENHIWATGTNTSDGSCVVLQYDGSNWTTVYENINKASDQIQYFRTVWTDNLRYIYLDGGSSLHKVALNPFNIGPAIKTGVLYVTYRIRGIRQNDVFKVTMGGEIAHFNGSSWNTYPEIQALNNIGNWWFSVHPKNDFVVIGGLYLTTYNSAPIVVRGYR